MDKKKTAFYYGIFLVVIGFIVFVRIPQVTPQIEQIEFFSRKMGIVQFCLYFLGVSLIVAGGVRIYKNK